MSTDKLPDNAEQIFLHLESRVFELVRACERMQSENDALRKENERLNDERGLLMLNRDKVRTQVEAMITRLKALENG